MSLLTSKVTMLDAILYLEKGGFLPAADFLRRQLLEANDRFHLSELKNDLGKADRLFVAQPLCRIWSDERQAWWRQKTSGYTTQKGDAGIYNFSDAWTISSHCSDDKGIVYEILDESKS